MKTEIRSLETSPSPKELETMLQDLSLDPDARAAIEQLLAVTLAMEEQDTMNTQPQPDPETAAVMIREHIETMKALGDFGLPPGTLPERVKTVLALLEEQQHRLDTMTAVATKQYAVIQSVLDAEQQPADGKTDPTPEVSAEPDGESFAA